MEQVGWSVARLFAYVEELRIVRDETFVFKKASDCVAKEAGIDESGSSGKGSACGGVVFGQKVDNARCGSAARQ